MRHRPGVPWGGAQRKPDTDEGLSGVVVEAIEFIPLTDRELINLLATLLSRM
jgi:hypothetical protein